MTQLASRRPTDLPTPTTDQPRTSVRSGNHGRVPGLPQRRSDPPAVIDAINAQAVQERDEHRWTTCEPIQFDDRITSKGRLIGKSRYGILPPRDGAGRGHLADDLRRIIRTLAAWSKRYQVDWVLSSQDDKLGRIESGEVDRAIVHFAARVEAVMRWAASRSRAR